MNHSESRRDLYTALWLGVTGVIVLFNLTTIQRQFAQAKSLPALSPEELEATLHALGSIGVSTTVLAVIWTLSTMVTTIIFIGLGWVLVRRGQPAGFSTYLAIVLICMTAMVFPPDINELFTGHPFQAALVRSATFIGVSGFFIMPLVFPNGQFVPRWTIALAGLVIIQMVVFAFTGSNMFSGSPGIEIALDTVVFGTWMGAAWYRYQRVSTPNQRRQTRWVLFGFLIGVPCFLVGDAMMRNIDGTIRGAIFVIVFPFLVQIGFCAPGFAMAISVVYRRLFDVDVVLNKTLVWGTLSALVFGGYILIVSIVGAVVNVGSNLFVSALAASVVAVTVQPLRHGIQRGVNQLMFGDRDEPYRVISRLGNRLAATQAISDLLPNLLRDTAESLRIPYMALHSHQTNNLAFSASFGDAVQPTHRFPLTWQGDEIGIFEVSPRTNGGAFGARDRKLLEDLASQFGMAMYAVNLAEELQLSRERLVNLRESERRRIRRDLHDGLGAQLAGIVMQTNIAKSQLAREPEAAAAELELIGTELRSAIEGIRQLVHGLRPPALDELGLDGAVKNRLDRISVSLDGHPIAVYHQLPTSLPPLSAATEVAAFHVIEEAVTNVLRHAHANTLRVQLDMDGDDLHLLVQDDGVGKRDSIETGIGMHTMQERIGEIGGRLDYSNTHPGFRVEAWLPTGRIL